jgi:hypothetical protein
MIAENNSCYYYLEGLQQVLQFGFVFHKKCQPKEENKIKEHFSFRLSEDSIKL